MRTPLLASLMLLACGPGPEADRREPITTAASLTAVELENGLPYDGCTWVVLAGTDRFAPDEASEKSIVAFTQNAIGKTKAKADFIRTGKTRSVPCGWSASQPLPEISIRSLVP